VLGRSESCPERGCGVYTIREAIQQGLSVRAVRRETADGWPVCIFVCGETAGGGSRLDEPYFEAFVCGADADERGLKTKHYIGMPMEIVDVLYWQADVYTASELVVALEGRIAAYRAARHSAVRVRMRERRAKQSAVQP